MFTISQHFQFDCLMKSTRAQVACFLQGVYVLSKHSSVLFMFLSYLHVTLNPQTLNFVILLVMHHIVWERSLRFTKPGVALEACRGMSRAVSPRLSGYWFKLKIRLQRVLYSFCRVLPHFNKIEIGMSGMGFRIH